MLNWLRSSILLAGAFVCIRVYLSYMWLTNAENKLVYDFSITPLLKAQVEAGLLPKWWASFLESFVLANTAVFETFVIIGELGVGVALLLGLFTRFSALMGMTMNASFYLTFGAALDLQMLLLQFLVLVCFVSASKIGLDRYVKGWIQQARDQFFQWKEMVK